MKHPVLSPGGSTYLSVYLQNKMLCLKLPTGYVMHLDAKAIPQLVGILQELQKEIQ